jgi:hypothetical protein
MAVLVEGISVIVRSRPVKELGKGYWMRFQLQTPSRTLSADGELFSVSFLSADAAMEYVFDMIGLGLTYRNGETAEDISVVDMLRGPLIDTPWLQFAKLGTVDAREDKIAVCWLYEGSGDSGSGTYLPSGDMDIATPKGWTYEKSISVYHSYPDGKSSTQWTYSTEPVAAALKRQPLNIYRDSFRGQI